MSREEEREGEVVIDVVCKERGDCTRVDDLAFKLETSFFMVSILSTKSISSVGQHVDSWAYLHMTFNGKIFSEFHEQDAGMQVVLGDDAWFCC